MVAPRTTLKTCETDMQKLGARKDSANPQEKLIECIDRALAPLGKNFLFDTLLSIEVAFGARQESDSAPSSTVRLGARAISGQVSRFGRAYDRRRDLLGPFSSQDPARICSKPSK
ncbi:MAG: hypothetical protein JRN67_08395, partial [Nitrososphaerota archaeon]|nr:hypothetical protein [Nitrososphaerota archaeon]